MKKFKMLVASAALVAFIYSFEADLSTDFIGNYGAPLAEKKGFTIQLNSDHSFVYQDYFQGNAPVLVSGTWTEQNGKALLTSTKTSENFIGIWKLEKDGNAIKARKGLCWYRLCKN